jgi:L-ascorbate metabolism protein UlaG (beta-lactamase superfamily)
MENGQYNDDWRYIHLMPEDLVQAAKDLTPQKLLTIHHSKYALSKHSWQEPLDNISKAAARDSLPLITPMIGEAIYLNDGAQVFGRWWKSV